MAATLLFGFSSLMKMSYEFNRHQFFDPDGRLDHLQYFIIPASLAWIGLILSCSFWILHGRAPKILTAPSMALGILALASMGEAAFTSLHAAPPFLIMGYLLGSVPVKCWPG